MDVLVEKAVVPRITRGTYTQLVTEQHRPAGQRLDEVFAPEAS